MLLYRHIATLTEYISGSLATRKWLIWNTTYLQLKQRAVSGQSEFPHHLLLGWKLKNAALLGKKLKDFPWMLIWKKSHLICLCLQLTLVCPQNIMALSSPGFPFFSLSRTKILNYNHQLTSQLTADQTLLHIVARTQRLLLLNLKDNCFFFTQCI